MTVYKSADNCSNTTGSSPPTSDSVTSHRAYGADVTQTQVRSANQRVEKDTVLSSETYFRRTSLVTTHGVMVLMLAFKESL